MGQNAHPPAGMRHLQQIHHPQHPLHRQRAFEKLYGHGEREGVASKIARREMLSPLESLHRILEGNREHQRRAERFSLVGSMPSRIRCLLLVCADARLGGMFRFEDFSRDGIVPVYVAGNVADVFKSSEMAKLLGRMEEGASVIIVGHSKCGAVQCAREIEQFSSHRHRNIRELLACVRREDEKENLAEQAKKLAASAEFCAAKGRGVHISCAFARIEGETPSVETVGRASAKDIVLIMRLSKQFEEANRGQDLSAKQYAHAIVVSDPNYCFDAREIAGCAANEIFCISAASREDAGAIGSAEMALSGLLDEHAIASAEYSITHNKTRHIVIVHPQHEQIEAQMIAQSEIIRDAVLCGEVEITTMEYSPKTGRLTPIRHLVNQDAQSVAV